MMPIVWTTSLSQQDYDVRDYQVGNLIKEINIEPPETFIRPISKTYKQSWSQCTAFGTTHSMQIQNEHERKAEITLDPMFLWEAMGHQPMDKWGDSIENAVKTAVKKWIKGTKDWEPYVFNADGFAFGKRNNRKQVTTKYPLITVIYWNWNTRQEMLRGEVKTNVPRTQKSLGHCVCIWGFDKDYAYFYNSWNKNKGNICEFKISRDLMFEMMKSNMLNWRYFVLYDKVELNKYAEEIELSKQIIKLAKKLYEKWESDVKQKFEERLITNYLQNRFWFKYE